MGNLSSSAANSITFKDTSGIFPNPWNRLHENFKVPGRTIIGYPQKVDVGITGYLQFYSTVADIPVLKAYLYDGTLIDTINGSLANEIHTTVDKYYFNFSVYFDSVKYLEKQVYFILTQGVEFIESEPVLCYDMTEDIEAQRIKRLRYSNQTSINSDLKNYSIDWAHLSSPDNLMTIYIEDISVLGGSSESDVLTGSQTKKVTSSTVWAGMTILTDPIPWYLVEKLRCISTLDYFEVNGIQYIIDGGVEANEFAGSTSYQCTIKLTAKNIIGLNVDNLGVDTETITLETMNWEVLEAWADFDIEIPQDYDIHYIKVTNVSGNDSVLTAGYSFGGTDLIDSISGVIPSGSGYTSQAVHNNPTPDDAGRLYFGISGSGVLRIFVQFIPNK